MNRPWQRLYNARWRKERRAFLNRNPLCEYCKQVGKTTAAEVVDHRTPHRGDFKLFWNVDNWQALCKRCHDGAKAIEEARGSAPGCDASGWPIDSKHEWNEG